MNIKVFFQEALKPGRDKIESSALMTVVSVSPSGNKFRHKLVGNGSAMVKVLDKRYAVDDKLIVSSGEVVGKSKKTESVFFV